MILYPVLFGAYIILSHLHFSVLSWPVLKLTGLILPHTMKPQIHAVALEQRKRKRCGGGLPREKESNFINSMDRGTRNTIHGVMLLTLQ